MPGFRHRLTRTQQRIYDRSDAVASIRLPVSPRLRQAVAAIPSLLEAGTAVRVEQAAQAIADEICLALRIAGVHVQVSGTRPSNTRGELHGLYTASERAARPTIKVWMLTAKRGQVVAFKTFLRTLLHEICHHLDYAHLKLEDSFHTDGFYKRESSLFYQIGGADLAPVRHRATVRNAPTPSS
jgi:hypothetical protein